ncbi:unnamed protein product [Adineta ricciae]|uniref:Protein quiver n=1 Tax=Adineta ricciae TaxID=249248 RepID=A0A814ENQ3_ADIRI|nr:unnamed protein product [Adineta ricciae]
MNYGKTAESILMEKLLLLLLLKFKLTHSLSNQSCYTCVEPLVGYTDHTDSCRFFDPNSLMASSYIRNCDSHENENYTGEYECRKLVISYRSVDTYLRRDCVRKGSCSWKDKTQSMIYTPISDCVYTDDSEQKLECIYCCNTPLCNRTALFSIASRVFLLVIASYCYVRKSM